MKKAKQELFLVFGGELRDPQGIEFVDLDRLETIGIYPSYRKALDAWRGASQKSVDNAFIRYVIVHLHDLLHPVSRRRVSKKRSARRT